MRSDSFNRDLTVTFEHTLLGARCFYRVDAPWTVGGFIVGENNVTLIEQEKLTTDISSPLIVSELEYWTKVSSSSSKFLSKLYPGVILSIQKPAKVI
ncbi:hypothetical protein NECAME_14843 [Necator americanus]|uniref:Uncharacterized protein n=1 Tax=Necator americanus TaxID=51031 RepID=W2SLD0_NECAM|nr:hypothetical protein NECAME_14843 [Necator americanus]ETN70333.1 hypothetical protein NECAME_14843 [Necator americanus]